MKRAKRSWMYNRVDGDLMNSEFVSGVNEFIEFAKQHQGDLNCDWLISDKPRKKGKVCPPWMHKDVHELLKKRSQDPAFILRSERGKKNKRGGSTGSIHPGHVQGSVSTHAIARRMAAKDGKLPSAADVYLKTHTKKDPVKGQVTCSEKPKKVLEEYENKLAEYKEKEITKDPNEVYLEVVGGRKRGLKPGLGKGGDLWFKKSTTRCDSSSSTYTPSIVLQLSTQMEQSQQQVNDRMLELERKHEEFEKQKADFERERLEFEKERLRLQQESGDERRKVYNYIESMKKILLENSLRGQQCKSKLQLQPRNHQDPSNGGAPPCAT